MTESDDTPAAPTEAQVIERPRTALRDRARVLLGAPRATYTWLVTARRTRWMQVLLWALFVGIVVLAGFKGVELRRWAFIHTHELRFSGDIKRGWGWGYYNYSIYAERGGTIFDTYDYVGIQDRRNHNYIDYAPLRLLTMTSWAAWNQTYGPAGKQLNREFCPSCRRDGARFSNTNYRPTPEQQAEHEQYREDEWTFHRFVLGFNTVMEAIGAIGAFMLVRYCVRRHRAARLKPVDSVTGMPSALAAMLIAWFNPAMILSSQGWPTWDMWVVPPFLWAVYMAVSGRWFWAGVIVAVGALFKGQTFAVLPVFLLWPVFQGRFLSLLRFVAGGVFAFGVLTCVWTTSYLDPNTSLRVIDRASFTHALLVAIAALVVPGVYRIIRWRWGHIGAVRAIAIASSVVIVFWLTAWPVLNLFTHQLIAHEYAMVLNPLNWRLPQWVGVGIVGVAIGAIFMPWRGWLISACGMIGAGLLSNILYHGNLSFAWFDASFLFGTDHWEVMVMGKTSNLPGILQDSFNWPSPKEVMDFKPFAAAIDYLHIDVREYTPTLKEFLFTIFLVLLVIATAGIALYDRRKDSAVLIAVIAPWMLFFTIPAQIHERYLLFAAGAACICIGRSVGFTLLGFYCTVHTFIMTLHVMLTHGRQGTLLGMMLESKYGEIFGRSFGPKLLQHINATFPESGWAVMLATAAFFYYAVRVFWTWDVPVKLRVADRAPEEVPDGLPVRER